MIVFDYFENENGTTTMHSFGIATFVLHPKAENST